MTASTTLETSTVCQSPKVESMGAFHSTQNFRIFDWFNKWNRPFRFGPTGIFGTSFGDGPLWLVWSFRSVGQKCPFPFDKIVVPSTALLYPAYKNITKPVACENSRTEHVEFPTFQTGIFVEWKAPSDIKYLYQDWFEKSWMKICWRKLVNNLLERSCN